MLIKATGADEFRYEFSKSKNKKSSVVIEGKHKIWKLSFESVEGEDGQSEEDGTFCVFQVERDFGGEIVNSELQYKSRC